MDAFLIISSSQFFSNSFSMNSLNHDYHQFKHLKTKIYSSKIINKKHLDLFLSSLSFRLMDTLELRINQFFNDWQYYYFPDRESKCKPQIDSFIAQIDQLLEKHKDTKKEKALLFYLRGKVLDFLPCYEKSAEQYLNKSIKLNPANGDCWNCLAHVLYQKKDYEGSQKAIEMALDNKGNKKVSLRYQSVLLRNQGTNFAEKSKNVEQSVKLAKQAIMLDMKDPETWYFLGNAYINNFFINFKKVEELQNAIKAYNQAVKDLLSKEKYFNHRYPDLFFNRATAESHLQDYQKAITDFKQAESIDPRLDCVGKIETLRKRLDYFKNNFERARELKPQKIQELIKNIPNAVKDQETVKIVPLDSLKERYNPNKMLSVKILMKLTMDNDIPESFLAIDSSGRFICLSIYNANSALLNEKIKKDVLIQVKDPELKRIKFGDFECWSVQVFELINVWVNRTRLTKNQFVPNLIVNTTVQKPTQTQ